MVEQAPQTGWPPGAGLPPGTPDPGRPARARAHGGSRMFTGIAAGLTKNYIIKPFVTFFACIFVWGFNALVKASPGRARWIAQKVSDQFFMTDPAWSEWVAGYMNTMIPGAFPKGGLAGKSLKGMSDAVAKQFSRQLLETMLQLVMPSKGDLKTDPLKGATNYLSTNLQFQMDAWMLHMLGDMQSFGIFKSLKDLPNAISWSFGLGWLSWLVMGVPFRVAITTSMERYFNSYYQVERLTPAQLCKSFRSGLITGEDFFTQMSEYGYSQEVQNQLLQLSEGGMSETRMKELYKLGLIDEKYIKRQFSRKGDTDQEAEVQKDLIVFDRVFTLRDKIVDEAVDLFEVGELSEGDLTSYLETAGWSIDEINMQVTASLLVRSAKGKLSNTDIANAVEKGLMPWAEARTKLEMRGFTWEDAEMYLKLRVPEKKWRES